MVIEAQDVGLVLQALNFAAFKHRDQRRKDTAQTPYINHPIAVAHILWDVGHVRDSVTLVAAILHDTLEDTTTTAQELESVFGPEILALVHEVSDDKRLAKEERKRLQIEHAPDKSPNAKLIKLADKIHNVHNMGHSPPHDWPVERVFDYLNWSKLVVAGLRGVNLALDERFDAELMQAEANLQGKVAS